MNNHHRLTIDIRKIPEALAGMRTEIASLLREEADADANPAVARRLREIAAAFECGQRIE